MADRERRLRTLFLNHTTVPGGAEFALVRMLRADTDWNAVVLLARPGSSGDGVFADLPPNAPLMRNGVTQRFGASSAGRLAQADNATRLAAQAAATRIHRAFRTADVVVANTTRAAAYGALAARTSRTPFVVHVRDLVEAEAIGGMGAAIMQRIVLPRADGVVADTERALASALPFVRPGTPVSVIPSASGISRGPVRDRGDGPVVLGMLARIDPWKGQELLLDAFARAFPDGDERLEFAGGAPFGHEDYAEHLRRRAADLGVSNRVELLGHVDDVDAVLARWHIAVQASTRPEPLGQNVLQYLAAGCATVVADEGGPTEWVDDGVNGRRFAPRDVEALASVLGELGADDAQRGALARAAAETEGLRTDAEIAAEHAAFYEDVWSAVHRSVTS
ncbi:glycosyltransferase family 4 protein [Microbacterium sp. ASV49]|uniref:Glycosyltransferase family 4 protein n=1 Tax=Microbacterium candidum TaxID=3041922 RepID=A0ABT7MV23_9MICO|nr:glycosyltransferase family 4 protein [Microbacterium sp. ASV49]MDL9978285.1 glycosyltransferase family 4 protein [Microbacterium sp. ASV49]